MSELEESQLQATSTATLKRNASIELSVRPTRYDTRKQMALLFLCVTVAITSLLTTKTQSWDYRVLSHHSAQLANESPLFEVVSSSGVYHCYESTLGGGFVTVTLLADVDENKMKMKLNTNASVLARRFTRWGSRMKFSEALTSIFYWCKAASATSTASATRWLGSTTSSDGCLCWQQWH
jgi:hypothetical protein